MMGISYKVLGLASLAFISLAFLLVAIQVGKGPEFNVSIQPAPVISSDSRTYQETILSKPVTSETEPKTEQQINTAEEGLLRPFVKVKEDESNSYYEGYQIVSGTYDRSGSGDGYFIIDVIDEKLLPGLKARTYSDGKAFDERKSFGFDSDSGAKFMRRTGIPLSNKVGNVCHVSGKAKVIISSYRAVKGGPNPGDYNEATIVKVLSEHEEGYLYWEQRHLDRGPDCTATHPSAN
ncbi:MAG: hypothetical protein ABI747_04030 [Candidatus Moraniibacteriota bacterium]